MIRFSMFEVKIIKLTKLKKICYPLIGKNTKINCIEIKIIIKLEIIGYGSNIIYLFMKFIFKFYYYIQL